jgi:Cu+-exporting ATPase
MNMNDVPNGAQAPAGQQAATVTLDTGGPVAPGEAVRLQFSLSDVKSGEPVNPVLAHEAEMHLIVASQDLGYFAHVHPKGAGATGVYEISHIFPASGSYILYSEFELEGTGDEVHRFNLSVGEGMGKPADLTEDLGVQRVDGYEVRLDPQQAQVVAGEPAGFVLNVTRNGAPVTDLAPYLGAASHVVVIDEGARSFAHVHSVPGANPPGGESGMEMDALPERFGPDLAFAHTFEEAGRYKVWAQFSHEGQVHTVSWVVEVLGR